MGAQPVERKTMRIEEDLKLDFKDVLIRKLLKKANEGDLRAMQEVFDRTEGRAIQPMEQTGEVTVTIKHES